MGTRRKTMALGKMTEGELVDHLGDTMAASAPLLELEGIIKTEMKRRGVGDYIGERYQTEVVRVCKKTHKLEKLRERLKKLGQRSWLNRNAEDQEYDQVNRPKARAPKEKAALRKAA